jgi:rare lipoprotein A
MARIMGWRIVLGLAASGFLAACVETSGTAESGSAGATGGSTKVRAGAEVEAPEVFQTTDSALWDGRPSLGGIWVASPDAVDPERVVMFNPATGKTVKGALFKRERDNPGPRLQLSSDAAEALGVLAGMPTEIQVTALRKQEVVEETVPEVVAPTEADAVAAEAEPAAGAEAGKDAATVAAAALDAVDAGAGAGAEVAAAADPAAAAVTAEEPPKRKTWKEKRAEAKAAREAKKAAEAAAAAGEAPVAEGTEAPTAETAGVAAIESAPLDARKPEVAAGNDPDPKPAKAEAAEEDVTAPTDPAPVEAGGATRTIQIASFSKEDNANRAVEALSKIGIAARVTKLEKDGKAVWGVVATGDQAMLNKIKDAGFADAYFLK